MDPEARELVARDFGEEGGGMVTAVVVRECWLVEGGDDHEARSVGGYDPDEPGAETVVRVATFFDIQFLRGARLARDANPLQGGPAPGALGPHDAFEHPQHLAGVFGLDHAANDFDTSLWDSFVAQMVEEGFIKETKGKGPADQLEMDFKNAFMMTMWMRVRDQEVDP